MASWFMWFEEREATRSSTVYDMVVIAVAVCCIVGEGGTLRDTGDGRGRER